MALMICPECTKEVPEGALSCPNCGCPVDSSAVCTDEVVLKQGFVTFTNANLRDAATLLAHTAGSAFVSNRRARIAADNLGKNGQGVLTDKRFVFGTGKALKKIAAGEALNFADPLARGDIVFNIPLAEITAVTKGKQGFSTLFALETNDGVYKFALMKKSQYDEWEAAFNKALGK